MSFDIQKKLIERFGTDVCETVISENVALAEAPALSRDIYTHAADSRGAADYLLLRDELQSQGLL